MDSIYHLIINIGVLLSAPFLLIKMAFDSSFRADVMGRFFTHRKLLVQKGCIWIHASSVCEVRAANILIQGMKAPWHKETYRLVHLHSHRIRPGTQGRPRPGISTAP